MKYPYPDKNEELVRIQAKIGIAEVFITCSYTHIIVL